MKAIATWAKEHGVWIIADEIYRRISYGNGPAASFLDLPDGSISSAVVVIYGGQQGLRDDRLADRSGARTDASGQSHGGRFSSTDHRCQPTRAVGGGGCVQRPSGSSRTFSGWWSPSPGTGGIGWSRGSASSAPGVEFVEPHGAFYFFFRVDGITKGLTGTSFCDQAMAAGVAMVPGAAFGDDRWVRMSYAVSDQDLEKALDRILDLVGRLAASQAA